MRVAGPTRVVVVDDHAAVSELMCRALDNIEDFDCVGMAHTGAAAQALVRRERPDAVLMDVQLGDEDGLELTSQLMMDFPELRVLVLTARTDSDLVQRAAASGACALLPKNGSLDDVLRALRTATGGGLAVHPILLLQLLTSDSPHPASPSLTDREATVLRLLASGMGVRQISHELVISEHTARGHVKKLLVKLDAHSQLEAVAVGKRLGLVE